LLGLVIFLSFILTNQSFTLATANFENPTRNDGEFFLGQAGPKRLEPPDFSLVQGNSLTGFFIPSVVSPQVLGSLTGDDSGSERGNEIIEYTVQVGDTLTSIAEQFDISLETLLWANNLSKSSSLKPGQKLIILPVSGVLHHVRAGETVSKIAQIYKGNMDEIIVFNELSNEGDINIGDILIIPNGVMPPPTKTYTPSLTPLASSYFICPISSPCHLTQGLHWYNAVDLSHGNCGEPIYAAASGQVLKIKYGWNGGAGNYLTILHPNGVVTMYGHLQSILVSPGQQVSQGQIIALMGGQPGTPGSGRSTGCHLHFGVTGARNPFAR
jgi:murein DD-endopeptidase MepM/ murein hydrolase activator NlpD